jgi:hypothetical protein
MDPTPSRGGRGAGGSAEPKPVLRTKLTPPGIRPGALARAGLVARLNAAMTPGRLEPVDASCVGLPVLGESA